MKRFILFILVFLPSQALYATLKFELRKPDGSTNWQHVANWSAGVLILLLTAAAITIFIAWKKARKANCEL